MKKGIFICFTGIDGSGKTTLANMLVESMKQENMKYRYVYNRYSPFLIKPFMIAARALFLRKNNIFKNYEDDSRAKKKIFRNHALSVLYLCCVLFDYSIQILVKTTIPLMSGSNIICDRYIYDTICTDLAIDLDLSEEYVLSLLEKSFVLFPRPNITFLIDIPEEVAYSRKDDVPSLEYLRDRRSVYLRLCKRSNMITLDGLKSPKILKNISANYIKEITK